MCPALMYACVFPRPHPSWWCEFLYPAGHNVRLKGANFAPTIPTLATAGIHPPTNASGGLGRGGRHGGRRRGGSRLNINQSAYGREPPETGGDAAGGGANNNPQHNNKWFANTNMCYCCGWDVPYWHTRKTCPAGYRNSHHQEGCGLGNTQAYINAGHNVRLKGK